MATITSTADALVFESKYKCYNTQEVRHYYDGESIVITDRSTSAASKVTQTLTFNYTLPEETINMAVLQMTVTQNTYGGSLYVNYEGVYLSNGKYTVYLDPSTIGTVATSFTLEFTTYTKTHYHSSDYDLRSEAGFSYITDAEGNLIPVDIYTLTKNHEGVLRLEDITLKIYTGDDFVSAPSTSALFVGVDGVAKKVTDMFVGVNGVAKKISDAWIGVNGVARKFWPCLELKDVPVGSIIQLDEAGDGTLVDYIVVAQNHYLNDTNIDGHTVFMRKNILNTTSQYGDNTYGECYKDEALDRYVNETWKASLDGRIIMKLMDITIPCTTWSHPYTSFITRQVWVPARAELDNSSDFIDHHEAPCFAYFENITTNTERVAYNDSGTASAWWTRSCVEGMGTSGAYIRVVNAEGNYTNFKETVYTGVRPVFCLPNSLPVSQIAEGQYDLIL